MMKTSNNFVSKAILAVVAIASTSQIALAAPPNMELPRSIDLSKFVTEVSSRSIKDESKMDLKLRRLVKQYGSNKDRSAGREVSKSELQRVFGISDKLTNPVVEVAISTTKEIKKETLAVAGARVRMQIDNMTFASVPVQSLETVAKLDGVQYMRAIVVGNLPKPACEADASSQCHVSGRMDILKSAPQSLLTRFKQERIKAGIGTASAKIASYEPAKTTSKLNAGPITPWKSIFARVPSLRWNAPVASE